jgi:hypothetical protein
MVEELRKPIANVTINYEDGTHDKLQYYAVVGYGENTWYSVMLSPPSHESKIRMNNTMVELSGKLLKYIHQEK